MNKATLLNTTTQTTEEYDIEIDGVKYNYVCYLDGKGKVIDDTLTNKEGEIMDMDELMATARKLADEASKTSK